MGRHAGIKLSVAQQKDLRHFMGSVKDKREYRAAMGVLLRGDGKSAKDVAKQLDVTWKQVFVWQKNYFTKGVDGLKMKKLTGRRAIEGEKAKKVIPELLEKDPQIFGFLKGRWVLRDISKALKQENINLHFSSVGRILDDMGIKLKSPKLRAPGSLHKNYRKRKQVRNYKHAAPLFSKKKDSVGI